MFDPKILLSPVSAVLDTLRRQNGGFYSLLLTKENIEFVSIDTNDNIHNTKVWCNDLDSNKEITKLGREIEYDRVNFKQLIMDNAEVVIGKDNTQTYHLLSYRDIQTSYKPTLNELATVLDVHYNLPIKSIDLDEVELNPVLDGRITRTGVPTDNNTTQIVNGTIEDELYTYTGGSVPVAHRNVNPVAKYDGDIAMELGMQFVRKQYIQETLKLSLPYIEEDDSWVVMFESVNPSNNSKSGELWFKLHLDTYNRVWALYINNEPPVWFSIQPETILTIDRFDDVVAIEGRGVYGESVTAIMFSTDTMLMSKLQRVTASTRNPHPRILQFKLESTATTQDDIEYNLVKSHALSNAVFNDLDKPIVITDAKCVNYIEDTTNRYIQRRVETSRGYVTKHTQVTNVMDTQLDLEVTGFIELCLGDMLKRMIFTVTNVNDSSNYVRVDYNVVSVNVTEQTMQVIISSNGVPTPEQTFKLYDLSGVFKIKVTSSVVTISSSYQLLGESSSEPNCIGPHQYSIKCDIELNSIGNLPMLIFNKASTVNNKIKDMMK